MTSRALAMRYARALFDVASKERADLTAVERDLSAFASLVAGHEGLGRVLANPAIPASRKRGVVEQLLARVQVSPILHKLLLMLAERDRLVLLPVLAAAFQQRLREHAQVVQAEVVTAIALPPDRVAALEQSLAQASGRQVQLEARVDPGIIGGAVTRVGSTVYDGSVTRQLEKLKAALIEGAL
ncbi:MAG: ATP synthase F1 subunit delta [Acidobacteria bacterium]|nr:ATP synthase F1 subunit delta [Acidobacteriota bacterium]